MENYSKSKLNIRQVVPEDVERVTEIEALGFPKGEAASHEEFRKRIETFPKSFFVGEEDGKIVTFINGAVTNSKTIFDEMYHNEEEHKEDGIYQTIFGICTHPAYRKKGLAEIMINHLIDVTRQRGKNGVILTCKAELIRYYEKFGFKNQGISASVHGGAVWYDMLLKIEGKI